MSIINDLLNLKIYLLSVLKVPRYYKAKLKYKVKAMHLLSYILWLKSGTYEYQT